MTRDKLLNSICPMSRVYDCLIADGDYDCDKCKRLTKEWFDEYNKQIRADVIDEFAKKLIQTVTSMTTGFRVVGNIERIAKELKEQDK
jgi:hypothetical protein